MFQDPALFKHFLGRAALLSVLLCTGGAALAGNRAVLPGSTKQPIQVKERRVELVPIADLLANPQRWVDRLIEVQGRLQPSPNPQGAIGCTRMACPFPSSAQPGDQRDCNRCQGPAGLRAGSQWLALSNLRCMGVEQLTLRPGGQVDRTIRWESARLEDQAWSLDRSYSTVGTLRRSTGPGADRTQYEFEIRSLTVLGRGSSEPIPGLW